MIIVWVTDYTLHETNSSIYLNIYVLNMYMYI